MCDQYCIYFLTQRARNVTFDNLLRNFNYDANRNEILVYKYVRDKFGLVQPPLINTEGLVLQVACVLVEIYKCPRYQPSEWSLEIGSIPGELGH